VKGDCIQLAEDSSHKHDSKYSGSIKVELSNNKLLKKHPATCSFNVESSFDQLRTEERLAAHSDSSIKPFEPKGYHGDREAWVTAYRTDQ
jgi:hypothetical protein